MIPLHVHISTITNNYIYVYMRRCHNLKSKMEVVMENNEVKPGITGDTFEPIGEDATQYFPREEDEEDGDWDDDPDSALSSRPGR